MAAREELRDFLQSRRARVTPEEAGLPARGARRVPGLRREELAQLDFDALPVRDRNHARWVFLNPASRERYVDWEDIARENVAALRLHAGQHPDDTELSGLIGELAVKSPEFASWWADHDVVRMSHGSKRYHHPLVGELTVSYEALPIPDATDQVLFIYTAEPGSTSEESLRLLASWSVQGSVLT